MTLHFRRIPAVLAALVAAASFLTPGSARAQTWGQFGVDVLPLPLGNYNFMYGGVVNDAGQVAGARYVSGTMFSSIWEAFIFDPGAAAPVQGLGFLDPSRSNRTSRGYGINNLGEVTGVSRNSAGQWEAFVHDGSAMSGLGMLAAGGYSYGYGINDLGQVAGFSRNAAGREEAFVHDGSAMSGLGTLTSGGSSWGSGINESGQVTGSSLNAKGNTEAFLHDGTMEALGALYTHPLGGGRSDGRAINESGQVAGHSTNAAGREEAFLHDGTAMKALGTLGGTDSYGRGISDAGQVVGWATGGSIVGGQRAALWEGGTGYFLDALVGGGWTFRDALGMSGAGTVLARGVNAAVNGGAATYVVLRQHADPNTVVPEPSTWLLLATGLVGIGVAARRRREGEGAEG